MFNINLYLYTFVLVTWIFFILNSSYSDHKIKKVFPDKSIILKVLTIPFYIFLYSAIFLVIEGLTENILTTGEKNIVIFNSSFSSNLVFAGIFFCLFSIILYSYVNFFEKSFPSCIAIKNNKPLRGLYEYVRHPSYYILFFITFGNALCLLSLPLFILACINHVCLYFCYIIEENQVRKINPDYEKYLKRSNRFLPNFLKISTD